MKKIFVLLIVLFSASLFAQENNNSKIFSGFHVGILAGVNYSNLAGGSIVMEGKTNLSENLNVKLSVGYSTINKRDGYFYKSYGHIKFDSVDYYVASSNYVDEIIYHVFPVSIGFEYTFLHKKFSPYILLEGGINYYSFQTELSNSKSIFGGYFDTYNEVPSEYKVKPPVITEASSMRLAFGLGTTYTISRGVNLDIRYEFQSNKYIVNTHQILFGINL